MIEGERIEDLDGGGELHLALGGRWQAGIKREREYDRQFLSL